MARGRETPHRTGCRGREAVLGRLSRRPAPCGKPGSPGVPGSRRRSASSPSRSPRSAVRRRLRLLPEQLPTLQWHGDTFDLPPGAIRLAGSPAYPNQAFKVRNAYGVQFHLEVSPGLAREWAEVPEYAASSERMLGPGALDRLIADLEFERERWARTQPGCSSAGSTPSGSCSCRGRSLVDVGAAIPPRREEPAADGDPNEHDERDESRSCFELHVDVRGKTQNGRRPADDGERRGPLRRVRGDLLPDEDERETPPDRAAGTRGPAATKRPA